MLRYLASLLFSLVVSAYLVALREQPIRLIIRLVIKLRSILIRLTFRSAISVKRLAIFIATTFRIRT